MILKLLQQALAKPGGESGPESTEAATLVEEAAAVLEVIIEELSRETLAALSLFRHAAGEHGATAEMILAVSRVVRARRGGAS